MKDKLSFYDVKSKSKFDSNEYDVREKNGRFFAVTKSQSGSHECLHLHIEQTYGQFLYSQHYSHSHV